MKRARDDTESMVYAYGVILAPLTGSSPGALRPCPLHAAAVRREVDLMHDFWDRLVDAWRAHEAGEESAARADNPDIARLAAARQALSAHIDALLGERRALRQKARAKIATPAIDAALEPLFAARRDAGKAIGAAMKKWRLSHKDKVKALRADYYAAMKTARRQSGLYWSNYNRVMDDFSATLSRCLKQGRRPRHVDRSREDGCLTVQIQRTKTGLGAAPGELLSGAFSGLAIRPQADQNAQGESMLAVMRVNADGDKITLPIILHRPIPEDCRVKSAQLVWRREGGRRRAKLCLTLTRPAVPRAKNEGLSAGVDIGWRLEPGGALRIATIEDGDGARCLRLDARWMAGMDKVAAFARHADEADAALKAALDGVSLDDALAAALASTKIATAWLMAHVQDHPDRGALPAPLVAWFHRRKHLEQYREGLRRRLINRRRELYRLFARDLAARCAVIGIEDIDLAAMARSKSLAQPIRALRVRAAPHILLDEIRWQARKSGARIEEIAGASTLVCNRCGERQDPEDRSQLIWTCNHCQNRSDQDVNAARNLREAAIGGERSQTLQKAMEMQYAE